MRPWPPDTADLAAMKKADDRIPQTVALVEETMGESMTRADLHISRSRDGELFITSRQDGTIRMLAP
jgi:hypothetical protein